MCEAIQKIVPWWIGTMGLRFSRAKDVAEGKEFAVTKKSLGGFDGWRGWLARLGPLKLFLLSRQNGSNAPKHSLTRRAEYHRGNTRRVAGI